MRFLILASAVAFGAAVIGATLPAPYADQVTSAARTVRNGAAKVIADPSELNPLRWVFDFVKEQVQTNPNNSSLFAGTPVTAPHLVTLPQSQFHLDETVVLRGQFAGNRNMPSH